MTVDGLRQICLALPGVTEDVKWVQDLCFCVGGKMFVIVNLEPPHQMSFKCTPDGFGELIEREGIIPAPYLARAMWVQESELGKVFVRRELEPLLRSSYDLVLATLPKSKRPGAAPARPPEARTRTSKPKPKARDRAKPKTRVKSARTAKRR
jgi:predicted DNA-binding protein (MmcQ/YjbR family)